MYTSLSDLSENIKWYKRVGRGKWSVTSIGRYGCSNSFGRKKVTELYNEITYNLKVCIVRINVKKK